VKGSDVFERRIRSSEADERRRALRALLEQPLLTPGGPRGEELVFVRRHAAWLREWLARFPGWSLQVDPELARLCKTPADLADGTRPARDGSGAPFTRRRYVLLCLALAALERADRQTTLGNLAKDLAALAAGDEALARAGFSFELSTREERRDLVEVVRLLLRMQVMVRVHGDEQLYLAEKGDVLYTVQRPALAAMLNVQRGPSTIEATGLEERLRLLVDEPMPETDESRNRRLRTRLVRRLLDDPVLYYEDLSDEERAYLTGQRHLLLTEIENATGLVREVRREGIAMADERGDLTDVGFPEEGTESHVTLLIAEHLAEQARCAPGRVVARSALEGFVSECIAQHRAHWRKDASEPGAEVGLTETALERLEALRLVARTAEGVVPRPAIARYTLEPLAEAPAPAPPRKAQRQLGLGFDSDTGGKRR
jgi:uncharacterized protein (TIGR02678 family)